MFPFVKVPAVVARIDLRFHGWIRSRKLSPDAAARLKRYVRFGDGWIWAVAAVWLLVVGPLLLGDSLARNAGAVARAFAAGVASLGLYEVVKHAAKRKRPSDEIPGDVAEVPPLDKYGFPSGHVMNNMAVALALAVRFPALGGAIALLALSWGILRVYFGVHYLSDVVGGAVLAALVALPFFLLNL